MANTKNDKRKTVSDNKCISIDLNILIEKIVLYPNSPDWYGKIVKGLLEKYNFSQLTTRIKNSNLDERPPIIKKK